MALDTSSYRRPDTLELTQHPEANRLIAQNPTAFLIGWILDQQIRVQQAFGAPLKLQERLGTLDPAAIAAMPAERVVEAVTEKPPLHRYGGSMGARIHACMQVVVSEYGGDPERIWLEAEDYNDLFRRITALPGFGKMKGLAVVAMLARRFGLDVTGFEGELPPYGTLSEVVQYQDLVAYQARKRDWKQAQKSASDG